LWRIFTWRCLPSSSVSVLGINWISTAIAHPLAWRSFFLSLHWAHLFWAIWKQFECHLHIAFRRMLLLLLLMLLVMEMAMEMAVTQAMVVGSVEQETLFLVFSLL